MEGKAQEIYKSIVVAQTFEAGTPARAAIDRSYRETQQVLAIAATAGLAPMLFIMFALKNINLDEEKEDNPPEVRKFGVAPLMMFAVANLEKRSAPRGPSKRGPEHKEKE